MAENRLYRVGDKWALDIPIPNPGLQEWLNGPECEAQLRKVTTEIYNLYVNALPEKKGVLRKGAGTKVARRGEPGQTERFHGWVTNRALSYRKTEGKPYPRFIEYGRKNKSGVGRSKAGYQLRWAAETVAHRRLSAAAMVAMGGESGSVFLDGDSGAGTEHHQARPAIRRPSTATQAAPASIELTKAPKRTGTRLTLQEKAKLRAQREAQAAAVRASMNTNKKPPPGKN